MKKKKHKRDYARELTKHITAFHAKNAKACTPREKILLTRVVYLTLKAISKLK